MVPQITACTGLPPTPPMSKFRSHTTGKAVTVWEATLVRTSKTDELHDKMDTLRPLVNPKMQDKSARGRKKMEHVHLANFNSGAFILVARY